MKIAIVGSRTYPDPAQVIEYIWSLPRDTVIVTGGAQGVDSVAEYTAKAVDMQVELHLPDWVQHGRHAGYLRNREIVESADKIVAFWDGETPGTKITIALAIQSGKPYEIIGPRLPVRR